MPVTFSPGAMFRRFALFIETAARLPTVMFVTVGIVAFSFSPFWYDRLPVWFPVLAEWNWMDLQPDRQWRAFRQDAACILESPKADSPGLLVIVRPKISAVSAVSPGKLEPATRRLDVAVEFQGGRWTGKGALDPGNGVTTRLLLPIGLPAAEVAGMIESSPFLGIKADHYAFNFSLESARDAKDDLRHCVAAIGTIS